MKIATFNINDINKRLDNLRSWLDGSRPDIVCLQEIKCSDEGFPSGALLDCGYRSSWKGQGRHHGVAILAKHSEPVVTRRALPGDDQDHEARYIEAAVDGLLVVSLYLPNGNPRPGPRFQYKMAWFRRFLEHAASLERPGIPVVLAGDYNVVPTDKDIYDMRSWRENALVQPEPRRAFAELMRRGWTDVIGDLHPDQAIYSFWAYLRQSWPRDAGMRLDHILISRPLVPRIVSAGVDRSERGKPNASDHAPAWIEIDWP